MEDVAPVVRRHVALMAATAHDLNEELTIIISALALAIRLTPPGSPARPELLEARSAVQRAAWKASGLLNYAMRKGARPGAATMERLIEWDRTGWGL